MMNGLLTSESRHASLKALTHSFCGLIYNYQTAIACGSQRHYESHCEKFRKTSVSLFWALIFLKSRGDIL